MKRKKKKITKSINKLKSKIILKEKKLAKVNVKIASIEKKVAEKKTKKLAKKKASESSTSLNN